MSYVRKDTAGNLVVCRRTGRKLDKGTTIINYKQDRDWWLIKHHPSMRNSCGHLQLSFISFPKEYIGRKIRIKIEVLPNERYPSSQESSIQIV